MSVFTRQVRRHLLSRVVARLDGKPASFPRYGIEYQFRIEWKRATWKAKQHSGLDTRLRVSESHYHLQDRPK